MRTTAKKTPKKNSTLKRAVHRMPAYMRRALTDKNLMKAYNARPAYQRNDYIGWINNAKLEATRTKRLNQMLRELSAGDSYMNMAWRPRE